jgi:glycosyltransferase involved in cell wall biosynthesis
METNGPSGHDESCVRVLEVIGNASMGGMENYIQNFISHLPPDQYKLTCICPYESRFTASLRHLNVEEVYITPIEDDPVWRSIQLTVEIGRLHKIDVLHAHMPKAHVLAGLAGLVLRKPVVASVHGMNVTSQEFGITRALGTHLITNCQEAYSQALAMGLSPERIDVVRNAVDTDVFAPRHNNKLRSSINISSDTPLVGFVGRLDEEKGPDLFLRAAQYVYRLRPDIHFIMAGEGLMKDELQDMCRSFYLEDNVHFVGWVNPAEVYPELDILAHTSRSDGTSLVLLEAMACECPTVGIAVGGVREIIEDGNTGLLAGIGDWEGAGMKIIRLLQDPECLRNMGIAARARVVEHFNLKVNALRTANVLKRIASPVTNGHKLVDNKTLSRKIGSRTL